MHFQQSDEPGDNMGSLESRQAPPPQWLVCVVDDDQSVRHGMANLLQSAGHTTICFDSAEAFLASERLAEIDFAVFDVLLGGISGFALQDRLAAARAHIPLVYVSAHGDSAMEQRALDAGAIALLRKPIDVDLLLAHIERTLGAPGAGR
jgi:FixJ family two-component response regulator